MIQIKRGTTASWSSEQLQPGQLGIEYCSDGTTRIKAGENTSLANWSSLPYAAPSTAIYQDDRISFSSVQSDSSSIPRLTVRMNVNGIANDIPIITTEDVSTAPNLIIGSDNFSSISLLGYVDIISSSDCSININPSTGLYFRDERTSRYQDYTRQFLYYDGPEADRFILQRSISYRGGTDTLEVQLSNNIDSVSSGSVGTTKIKLDRFSSYNYSSTNGYINADFYCTSEPYSSSIGFNSFTGLGTYQYPWTKGYINTLYTQSGTVQTSDRSEKSSIHYIGESASMPLLLTSSDETPPDAATQVTMDDVVEFVKTLEPATFCYLNGKDEATEENSVPEMIQLGLIADDIVDSKLFKYVGVEKEVDKIVEPEVTDKETGAVIKEAVTERKTTRGLQVLPLATAALATCKYLLQKIDILESRIKDLESL